MTESIQILVEKDRLQPLADNIKVLKGSDTITLQQMEDTIEETNTDIVSQTDLIAQLASALQGKSVPGGGGVETCTVNAIGSFLKFEYTGIGTNGVTQWVEANASGSYEVVANTLLVVEAADFGDLELTGDVTFVMRASMSVCFVGSNGGNITAIPGSS